MVTATIRIPLFATLATMGCLLVATPAAAAVIASQSPLDGGSAFESTVSFGQQNGDTFTLSDSGSITGLEWWGTQVADMSGFFVRVFDDLSANTLSVLECDNGTFAAPCGAPVVAASTALVDDAQNAIDKFSIDFPSPIDLASGTYLLSIGHETDFWFWLEGVAGDGVGQLRSADDESWQNATPDFSFSAIGTLDGTPGTVPEPTTLALLGLAGIGGVFAGARRRRT